MPEPGFAVIYDGGCEFCTCVVRWLAVRVGGPAEIVPGERGYLERYGIAAAEAERALQWVSPAGRAAGAAAVAAWLSSSPSRFWRFLGGIIVGPIVAPIAAGTYWFVARNRSHLSPLLWRCRKASPAA